MKIIITGGAGFIGSNYIRYILNKYDDTVLCLDKLTYAANPATLDDLKGNPAFSFARCDIADRKAVYSAFEMFKPDAVVNFAAETHVDNSIVRPEDFISTNVIGTEILMDACLKYNVNRFHQISTDEVYGDGANLSAGALFDEASPLNPSSPYSASKASADLLVMAYARTYGLRATISRSSNNYGPYQHPEKLVPKTIINSFSGEQVPIYGDGKQKRDWISVFDHSVAIDLILKHGEIGEIYNVTTYCEWANIDTVSYILENSTHNIECIKYVADRPGHDVRYSVSSDKIRSKLGWVPEKTFEAEMLKTIEWYRSNEKWWRYFVG